MECAPERQCREVHALQAVDIGGHLYVDAQDGDVVGASRTCAEIRAGPAAGARRVQGRGVPGGKNHLFTSAGRKIRGRHVVDYSCPAAGRRDDEFGCAKSPLWATSACPSASAGPAAAAGAAELSVSTEVARAVEGTAAQTAVGRLRVRVLTDSQVVALPGI